MGIRTSTSAKNHETGLDTVAANGKRLRTLTPKSLREYEERISVYTLKRSRCWEFVKDTLQRHITGLPGEELSVAKFQVNPIYEQHSLICVE